MSAPARESMWFCKHALMNYGLRIIALYAHSVGETREYNTLNISNPYLRRANGNMATTSSRFQEKMEMLSISISRGTKNYVRMALGPSPQIGMADPLS